MVETPSFYKNYSEVLEHLGILHDKLWLRESFRSEWNFVFESKAIEVDRAWHALRERINHYHNEYELDLKLFNKDVGLFIKRLKSLIFVYATRLGHYEAYNKKIEEIEINLEQLINLQSSYTQLIFIAIKIETIVSRSNQELKFVNSIRATENKYTESDILAMDELTRLHDDLRGAIDELFTGDENSQQFINKYRTYINNLKKSQLFWIFEDSRLLSKLDDEFLNFETQLILSKDEN